MIIGLIGEAGSGKDTVADIICQEYHARKLSLAAPGKEEVAGAFGITVEELEKKKRNPGTRDVIRGVLQSYLEHCKANDPWRWVREAALQISDADMEEDPPTIWVISDVRLWIEELWIRRHAGYIARVTRGGDIVTKEVQGVQNQTHRTETEARSILSDFTIDNSGAIEELQVEVKARVEELLF